MIITKAKACVISCVLSPNSYLGGSNNHVVNVEAFAVLSASVTSLSPLSAFKKGCRWRVLTAMKFDFIQLKFVRGF